MIAASVIILPLSRKKRLNGKRSRDAREGFCRVVEYREYGSEENQHGPATVGHFAALIKTARTGMDPSHYES